MTDSPIERYLDKLFVELRANNPRDARSLLSETEAHLRDAADEAERSGLDREHAEQSAVERFGDVGLIAASDRDRTATHVAVRIALSGWWLGCVGAIAVGVSGLIAGLMRLAGASTTFIAGSRATTNLTASDCANWLAGYPHAHSCAEAALNDWAAEIVGYRIAFGILGALALTALTLARRRSPRIRGWSPLPVTITNTIATTVFSIAALWLAGLGIDTLILSDAHGAGFWLSAAPVALIAAVIFGVRLLHDMTPTT